MKQVMVDIETLGNKSSSVITQIAAVEFDMDTGECGKTFNVLVDIDDCMDKGLKVNADTLMWWFNQSEEARDKIAGNAIRYTLKTSLRFFTEYLESIEGLEGIWGNSARFDLGILSDAYNAIKKPIPWDFRKERDVRTLVAFSPEIRANETFEGVPHDALDDCKHQIKYCSKIWNKLND